jgi:hypothetical protein
VGVRKPTSDEKFRLHQDLVYVQKLYILYVSFNSEAGFGFLLITEEREKKLISFIVSLLRRV